MASDSPPNFHLAGLSGVRMGLFRRAPHLPTSRRCRRWKSDHVGTSRNAHDQQVTAGELQATSASGARDYVERDKNYDAAFGKFLDRLAQNQGITRAIPCLFFTSRRADPLSASQPTNLSCDGVFLLTRHQSSLTRPADRFIRRVTATFKA